MKRLGVFLLLCGWDASESMGYPLPFKSFAGTQLNTSGWREALQEQSVSPKSTKSPARARTLKPLDLEASALTMRPPVSGSGLK